MEFLELSIIYERMFLALNSGRASPEGSAITEVGISERSSIATTVLHVGAAVSTFGAMQFLCACGARISDGTDNLPYKGNYFIDLIAERQFDYSVKLDGYFAAVAAGQRH